MGDVASNCPGPAAATAVQVASDTWPDGALRHRLLADAPERPLEAGRRTLQHQESAQLDVTSLIHSKKLLNFLRPLRIAAPSPGILRSCFEKSVIVDSLIKITSESYTT